MTKKREISAAEMGIIFSPEKRKSLAGKKGQFYPESPPYRRESVREIHTSIIPDTRVWQNLPEIRHFVS